MGEQHSINGLTYIREYLPQAQQEQLLHMIDQQPWLSDLKRRVQHYGYRYDYQHRSIDSTLYLGPLPDWAIWLAKKLYTDHFVSHIPDQLIVNEYEPGQGIASHIDCVPCFDDTILSLSLGAACVMDFTATFSPAHIPLLLEPGSLVIMRNEARYHWKHGIARRKYDVHDGHQIARERRVSLTFRKVILKG
ncbi:MAG: alpha-ketoglutarate-dependent dioxygenase AlkB [Chloroflexi bacterium AL-W]|nr:alpha-ketoglutarate-dependent dioxygenase AlkB [Chloroflexi bacterium AL-N1]NOK67140.1 alpha-ketoglutarate-dependent dioxygenase AlkB [Chloroflexi bacterium AL-N10]NOK74567.1 alpha-ketoglutarate-dependent dioxygenase AlkB [Chloroflexi bacterium AL-N5]NOK81742.1 alpha-ketoglutarate-dependent dioxygenase AlkB [Chloroflexi bacterium AL-W]NOK89212.1 alpha-ketoglutarate-dependent dioxygenase AlkB [Chloroflexi bacterium AL-N15]